MTKVVPKAVGNLPSEAEILALLEKHGGSLDAITLIKALTKTKRTRYEVQRAVQRALDSGAITLGHRLRIEAVKTRAAA